MSNQPSIIQSRRRTIHFYDCGGTATNTGRAFTENTAPDASDEFYADIQQTYLDTGISNLHGVDASNVYLYKLNKDTDGMGKKRNRELANLVFDERTNLFQKHPPADLNVVSFSMSGGSGASIGPALVESLIEEKQDVLVIMFASTYSSTSTQNFIDTMVGLEKRLRSRDRSLAIMVHINDESKSLEENNLPAIVMRNALTVLASGRNRHLDTSDISNFFNFHVATKLPPQIGILKLHTKHETLETVPGITALAAVLRNIDTVPPRVETEYDTIGYAPIGLNMSNDFIFTISVNAYAQLVDEIQETSDNVRKHKSVKTRQATLLTDDNADDAF